LIAVALPIPRRSATIESLLSINLATGQFAMEVEMGEFLVRQVRLRKDDMVKVYEMPGNGPNFGVVEGVWTIHSMSDPLTPPLYNYGPIDYRRSSAVRGSELLPVSYIFFEPPEQHVNEETLAGIKEVRNMWQEFWVFSAWLSLLHESDGVRNVMGGSTRLLEVIDHQKFKEAFSKLVAQHHWRDIFYQENGESPMDKLRRRFEASTATILKISADANADQLKAANQVAINTVGRDILMRSSGTDPYLLLPQIQVPAGKMGIVRVSMSSPKATLFQIFCFSSNPAHPAPRMLESLIDRGGNDLYFELPQDPVPLQWRMDPGCCEGDFLLREMEVRMVENDH